MIKFLICKLLKRHKPAVMEFIGNKPDLSSPEGCIKGIPVYRLTCPRCGVSIEMGEDEIAEAIKMGLAARFDNMEVLQYSSGYKPETPTNPRGNEVEDETSMEAT